MIKIFYRENIINRLAAIITFGLSKGYSYKSIEESLVCSNFINNLEKGYYDIESTNESVIEDVYKIKTDNVDISFRGFFLAESYINLFFYINKSFEYLFLYLPLSLFDAKYEVYHEMDFSNLRNDFAYLVSKKTLLKKLSEDRKIKFTEIVKLTGINKNTIDKYNRNDKYLYSASFSNIYKLAVLFGVKTNLFASALAVYLDQSIYLFDHSFDEYRSYLGYYYANYFDKRISDSHFEFDKQNNIFKSIKNGMNIVLRSCDKNEITVEYVNKLSNSDTYLVIFPIGFNYHKFEDYMHLSSAKAMEIMIVTYENVYIVKKQKEIEITDTISRSLNARAREATKRL